MLEKEKKEKREEFWEKVRFYYRETMYMSLIFMIMLVLMFFVNFTVIPFLEKLF